jgi:predicted ABC-type ATPase
VPRKPQTAEQEAEAEEFFYLNEDGSKSDAALHNRILGAVEYPIDEKIMGPIREKHRNKWLRERYRGPRNRATRDAYIESEHPRGEGGKWIQSSGSARSTVPGAPSNAARLYKASTKTADEVVAEVPGADVAVAHAREQLKDVVETHKPVSEGGFKQPDGSYTPERAALHQKILHEYINQDSVRKFSPEPGQNPMLTILGGRGGSGKGWLTSKDGPIDATKSMVIDSDEIKGKLPEYKGWNAAQLHEEATDIVNMIDFSASRLGLNVVLDGTLKSDSILKRIQVYQEPPHHEYELEGFYMYASPATAARRALGRFKTKKGDFGGRFVPPEVILGNTKNESNFDKMSESFRKWAVYDNDEDAGLPKLVEQGGRVPKPKRRRNS